MRKVKIILILAGAIALCLTGLRGAHTQSTAPRRVTNTSEEGISINPSISGDGKIIAFESTRDIAGAGGRDHFRAIRANVGVDPAAFVQMGGTRAVAPALSQDGSHIAFASKDDPLTTNPDGNSEIFLLDGAKLIQITTTSPRCCEPRHERKLPTLDQRGRPLHSVLIKSRLGRTELGRQSGNIYLRHARKQLDPTDQHIRNSRVE